MKYEEIAQLILSFVFISIFISIFFFVYVVKIEEEIIKEHINNSIQSVTKELSIVLTPEKRKIMKEIILQQISDNNDTTNTELDTAIDTQNNKIVNNSIIVFSIFFILGMILITILWWFYRFSFSNVFKYSIIMTILTAVVYFLFITYITRKYILVDSNYISYLIVSALYNYSNSS